MDEKKYLKNNWQRFLKEASEYLAIKSVSAQPEYRPEIDKAVDWLVAYFGRLGLKTEVWKSPGNPYVFASTKIDSRKPTVLIYGHYDVQPAEPLDQWISPPFTATVRKRAIYARGSCDDKLQHFVYLLTTDYLLKNKIDFSFNVKFIIEGEEEVGSVSAEKFLPKYREKLSADIMLVSDGLMLKKRLPTIESGARGLVCFELGVKTARQDLHSGLFGGAVDNAANLLAYLITKIKDRDQKILVPGIYQNVSGLLPEEKKVYQHPPLTEQDFCGDAGVKKALPEKGFSFFEASTARPTMDVNGIWAGYTQEGTKTIIPSQANAKLSFRLVPGQTAEDIYQKLSKYLRQITPPTATFTLTQTADLKPYLWEGDSQWLNRASSILKSIWKKEPVVARAGGSIGILDMFKRELGVHSLLVNFGYPDDNPHAPNEKFDLENLKNGFLFGIKFLSK